MSTSRFQWLGRSTSPADVLSAVVRVRVFGKSPAGLFLRVNSLIWQIFPARLHSSYPLLTYGRWLHRLVCLKATRRQYFGTCFFRNRPELELMRHLVDEKATGSTLRITVLACSIGAEVYSILWTLRSARPDLKLIVSAVDISREILNFAEKGIYSASASELVGSSIFERLTADELEKMFDWEGSEARVKPWLREGISWRVADASDPELVHVLTPQDLVVANNFLCHMEAKSAENCLRNIARLVKRGGCLFVSGVDLDVRAKVARELGWRPIPELIQEIHDGDPSVRRDWPWTWWGLEPLNRRRPDWQMRYAMAFRVSECDGSLGLAVVR